MGFGGDASGDTLVGIENLRGSDFGDTLIGDANSPGVDGNNEIDPGLARGGFTDYVDGGGAPGTDIDTLVLDYSRGDTGLGVSGGFGYDGTGSGSFVRLTSDGATVLDQVNYDNIEKLRVTGTSSADTVHGGAYNDIISTGGGDDVIDSGLGFDVVIAGNGNDFVTYGTDPSGQFSAQGGLSTFRLDGGSGIDALSISTIGYSGDVKLIGTTGGTEFSGINLVLPGSGGSAVNFETLRTVYTGAGDDILRQPGFSTISSRPGWAAT